MKKLFLIAISAFALSSCTEQQRAKEFGGDMTINLPKGEKLVNVTWKGEADIWYLTRPMTSTDSVQTYTFHQEKGSTISFSGNGTVTLIESK
jgi:hypothetical protein